MKKLAINGGEKSVSHNFSIYNSIGVEEQEAASKVVKSGILSDFLGAPGSNFLGGKYVKKFERNFEEQFEVIMSKWKCAESVNAPEPYVDFVERVSQVSDVLKDSGDRVLVVTSGGIIAKVLQNCLDLSDSSMIKFLLASMNTGVTTLNYSNGQFNVEQVNSLPHLDHFSRIKSRTFF